MWDTLSLKWEILGNTVQHRGILVVKDPTDPTTIQRKQEVPVLLSMNIGKQGKELIKRN